MNLIKIFLDTEFTGLHQDTTLISIALVSENNDEFYVELTDFDTRQVTPWIADNVLSKCFLRNGQSFERKDRGVYTYCDKEKATIMLKDWLTQFECVEIWADVLAYDWVLFCELFGGAINLPANIFYTPFDLSTFFRIRNLIAPCGAYQGDISRFNYIGANKENQHNALFDARVERDCFIKLMSHE